MNKRVSKIAENIIKNKIINEELDKIILERENFQQKYELINKNPKTLRYFGDGIHSIANHIIDKKEYKVTTKTHIEIRNNKEVIVKRIDELLNHIPNCKNSKKVRFKSNNIEISGEYDFMNDDTLYDIKCCKNFNKNKNYYLIQLFIYYSIIKDDNIKYIGIYDFYGGNIYKYKVDKKYIKSLLLKCKDTKDLANNIIYDNSYCIIL